MPHAALVALSMQMYSAPRMLHAHGSVSTPRRPGRGIVAGCGFAVWFLKAYLAPVIRWARAPHPAVSVRDYVDDIVVSDQASHLADALGPVVTVVTRLVEALESEGHQFAAAKTQLWSPSRAAKTVWDQIYPRPAWAPAGEALLGPTTPWGESRPGLPWWTWELTWVAAPGSGPDCCRGLRMHVTRRAGWRSFPPFCGPGT